MKRLAAILSFAWLLNCCAPLNRQDETWTQLFNGKSFQGWSKFLSIPQPGSQVAQLKRNEAGKYTQALGLNNDPLGVFTIVTEDGAPAIRTSGEVFGTLRYHQPFKNYHLTMQFKWGEKKWPPRLHLPRDAGLLYHGFGQQGSAATHWHHTQECQVQEGDTGDYWPIGNVTIDIPSRKTDTAKWWAYTPAAEKRRYFFSHEMSERRCLKNPDNEKPHGEWNTVELIALGDSSIHIVNGKVVMRLYHSTKLTNGKRVPLEEGYISLQSEGAELFYRNIAVRRITQVPKSYSSDFRL